jgi:hypothetical protein
LKRTVITAALSVILTFAGTAIAYNLLARDSRAAKYQDFSYNSNAAPEARQYGGCQGAGRGGCGGCGGPAGQGQQGARGSDIKATEELAARYYSETYGDTGFTVKVQDFGCHQEAYIIKGGQPVKRLSISGGNIYEVG